MPITSVALGWYKRSAIWLYPTYPTYQTQWTKGTGQVVQIPVPFYSSGYGGSGSVTLPITLSVKRISDNREIGNKVFNKYFSSESDKNIVTVELVEAIPIGTPVKIQVWVAGKLKDGITDVFQQIIATHYAAQSWAVVVDTYQSEPSVAAPTTIPTSEVPNPVPSNSLDTTIQTAQTVEAPLPSINDVPTSTIDTYATGSTGVVIDPTVITNQEMTQQQTGATPISTNNQAYNTLSDDQVATDPPNTGGALGMLILAGLALWGLSK
jgi:hypothetical protein